MFKIEWKIFNPKNKQQMKNERMSALLGRDVKVGEVLSAEDFVKIENALANPANEEHPPEKETSPPDLSQQIISAVNSAITPINKKLDQLTQKVELIEGNPGATTTTTPKNDGDDPILNSWEDPNNSVNKYASSLLGLDRTN